MHEHQPDPRQRNNNDEPDPEIPRAGQSYEQTRPLHPRIYVTRGLPLRAELTDGAWLDMARDPTIIRAELYAIFNEEEIKNPLYIWDHHDFSSFEVSTGALGLEGVQSIELLAEVAQGITLHGPAFAAWASVHEDETLQIRQFEHTFKGHHENLAAYAKQLFEPLHIEGMLHRVSPPSIEDFIEVNYGAIGVEMLSRGDIVALPADTGGIWVFGE
ncbi:antirestriction protein ArdA [Nocardia niigatensis]